MEIELAERATVGIRFIKEREAGKKTVRMDKVNQVLSLFGFGHFVPWPSSNLRYITPLSSTMMPSSLAFSVRKDSFASL